MRGISLKLPDRLVEESEECAVALNLSRAAYIRQAIERENRQTKSRLLAKKLAAASYRVRKESMRVNAEFDAMERDPDG